MKMINLKMFLLKLVTFILLGTYLEIVLCGFTYDNDYAEINNDNYGFDLSELRHVTAEQPKYNKMIRGYRGPKLPDIIHELAITGGPCDTDKYKKHLYPIHVVKTNGSMDEDIYHDIFKKLNAELFEKQKNGTLTWKEICYHRLNAMFCNSNGKCQCLEVKATDYYGLREEKMESYDPLTLKHYKQCRIKEFYGCEPTHSKGTIQCDEGLFCHRLGTCLRSSSPKTWNFSTYTVVLIFATILQV